MFGELQVTTLLVGKIECCWIMLVEDFGVYYFVTALRSIRLPTSTSALSSRVV